MKRHALTTCAFLFALSASLWLTAGCGGKKEAETKAGGVPETYKYLAWQVDGSVDLVTFDDAEVIHVPKEELGSAFGKGKTPFAGQRIAVAVISQGPKGGISGPLYRLRPAWQELTGAILDIASCSEIVERVMSEARETIARLGQL